VFKTRKEKYDDVREDNKILFYREREREKERKRKERSGC
jgi:hypothetical protein